jgi:DNA-binding response OmpR family regulator/anti-sigma regulatory factor (Ser/Thr protein kinase)
MTKILLIDDETRLRNNTAEMLELKGYDVVTAQDGIEGFAKAMSVHPDIILCDVMMPNSDGYDFLERIKKTHLSNIPVILLTARADREDERHGMSLGADDYITKPFEITEVITSIKARLDRVEQIKVAISQYTNQSTYELAKLINGHELRTPLNIISGMGMLLFELVKNESKTQAEQMIKHMQLSINSITSLTNNIYMYELLKYNVDEKLLLNTSSIDILGNIRELAKEFNREIDIKFEIDTFQTNFLLYVKNYICLELVQNALKFTNFDNQVTIESYIENNSRIIKVIDNGNGFNATVDDIQPFKKFSKRTDVPGLGLGLNNVKKITEKLGGVFKINTSRNKFEVTVVIPMPNL